MDVRLVVLGDGAVGKSALVIQFVQCKFMHEYDPTVEDSYRKQVVVAGDSCVLDILDTAGQAEYSSLRYSYMRNGQGFLLVYSITSKESFDSVKSFREETLQVKDTNWIPMILVGNKCDLEHYRAVQHDEGKTLADNWNCPFLETSALTRKNVEDVFQEVVKQVMISLKDLKRPNRKKCIIL